MHCVSRGGFYLVNAYCDLQEDDEWKKESYQACWLGLVLETRPQYKLTLSETDSVRRESYKQQQVAHLMVQRSPSQTLMLGDSNGAMTKYQLPLFNPSRDLHRATATSECTVQPVMLEKEHNVMDRHKMTAISQEVSEPDREKFRASSWMSSPREISHRVQRRE